jgi:hypothetical protein
LESPLLFKNTKTFDISKNAMQHAIKMEGTMLFIIKWTFYQKIYNSTGSPQDVQTLHGTHVLHLTVNSKCQRMPVFFTLPKLYL